MYKLIKHIISSLNKPPNVSQGEYIQLLEYTNELLEEIIKLKIENQNLRRLHQN